MHFPEFMKKQNIFLPILSCEFVVKCAAKILKIRYRTRGPMSCIAHLSAKDMLKSVVIEEKTFKNMNLGDLEQGQ